jgi:GNAT superfamily N-acetyltransferase
MITIRPIFTDDLKECAEVFVTAYHGPPWNYDWTLGKAQLYLSEYLQSANFIGFLATEENKIIGATFAHKKTWWTGPQLMIDEFFIAPQEQKKGVGKRLMHDCMQFAKDNHIGLSVLMTNRFAPAFEFYERQGYTVTEQYIFMFKQLT